MMHVKKDAALLMLQPGGLTQIQHGIQGMSRGLLGEAAVVKCLEFIQGHMMFTTCDPHTEKLYAFK